MYHSLSQSKQYVFGVLCIGDHHGSFATLLCLSKSNIYIFDPHSVSMRYYIFSLHVIQVEGIRTN